MAVTDRARIRAGTLRHKITIQAPVTSGTSRTWTTLASNVPASIQPQSGFERPNKGLGAPAETMIEVHIRFLPGVTARCRVLVAPEVAGGTGRVLEIDDKMNIREVNRLLVLMCREVTT